MLRIADYFRFGGFRRGCRRGAQIGQFGAASASAARGPRPPHARVRHQRQDRHDLYPGRPPRTPPDATAIGRPRQRLTKHARRSGSRPRPPDRFTTGNRSLQNPGSPGLKRGNHVRVPGPPRSGFSEPTRFRLLHHANVVVTDGDSYRMRQARAKGGTTLTKT